MLYNPAVTLFDISFVMYTKYIIIVEVITCIGYSCEKSSFNVNMEGNAYDVLLSF